MDTVKIFIIICAALYFSASAFYILKKNSIAYVIHFASFLVNAGLITVNWVHNGYVPFISMYQVLTFTAACFSITYLYAHFVNKEKWMARYFALCAGFVMIGSFFSYTTLTWYRPPALRSVWFIPHVALYMIGYPLCAVSFVLCLVKFYKTLCDRRKAEADKADMKKYDVGIYNVVRLAFPFITSGMLVGAIWANEIWGQYWSWDAKENWALVTWLFYTIYLHCYRTPKLRKIMYVFAVLGFLALLMTLFGINLFANSSQHAYS